MPKGGAEGFSSPAAFPAPGDGSDRPDEAVDRIRRGLEQNAAFATFRIVETRGRSVVHADNTEIIVDHLLRQLLTRQA